ncbi:MAG: redoxin domain-containing protein [Bacteroidetes bacterium]|nr:MAG: redoxin domain-containing protein [Bacteroidota bacterium]
MRQLIFSFLVLMTLSLRSQTLKPGDQYPDVKLGKILNGSIEAVSLRGINKYVLLDFGSTDCLPCLKLLPKLNVLQEKFKKDIQIFMVTKEPAGKVKKFLTNVPIAKDLRLPIIVEDSMLAKVFPHYGIPHEVWLAPNGEVLAITKHEYVSEENFAAVISGVKPSWPIKADNSYDESLSLMEVETTHKIHHSIITKFLEGVRTTGKMGILESSLRFERFINYTKFDLYNIAYGHSLPTPYPRLFLIDGSIRNDFFYDESLGYKEEWKRKNSYCYEIVFDSVSESDRYKKMRNDLDFSLGLASSLQKRKTVCLILTKIADTATLSTTNGSTIQSLISSMNRSGKFPLIVNETGSTTKQLGKIYIGFEETAVTNESALIKLLRKYGFELKEGEREIELLVIERKK